MIKPGETNNNHIPNNFNPSDFISTIETAEILDVKPGTLEIWRSQGKGPVFHKFGRSVRYYKPDLAQYFVAKRFVSTSDRGNA